MRLRVAKKVNRQSVPNSRLASRLAYRRRTILRARARFLRTSSGREFVVRMSELFGALTCELADVALEADPDELDAALAE